MTYPLRPHPRELPATSSDAWGVRDEDYAFFANELGSFVPNRIFDVHCHLYRAGDFFGTAPAIVASGPDVVDWAYYCASMTELLPDRAFRAVAFPFPGVSVDVASANEFLAAEVSSNASCLGQMLVTPDMDPEFIRETVRTHRLVGLKCYHVFSRTQPTFESLLEDFLPEQHVRVCHEEGLSITLHLVRSKALADPANQDAIRRLASAYPNARWVLAHAARGFNVHHTIAGIVALRGLRNVWCDTSAVTEAGAFEAVVRTLGHDRLLYGSDFPVSHLRGRCVAIGESFLWLTPQSTVFSGPHGPVRPVLVLLESLRALRQAIWNLGLKEAHIERIFHGNAVDVFGTPAR